MDNYKETMFSEHSWRFPHMNSSGQDSMNNTWKNTGQNEIKVWKWEGSIEPRPLKVLFSPEGCLEEENKFHFKNVTSGDLNLLQDKPNNKEYLGVQSDSNECE